MQRNTVTSVIYGLAVAACSLFMVSRNFDVGGRWSVLLLIWTFLFASPLLFAFAYPRFLLADSVPQNRLKCAALVHGAGGVTTIVLFILLSPFWKNPVRDVDESTGLILVFIAMLVVFFVAAISLLLKNESSLALLASILLWPYWSLLALAFEGRWFQNSGIHAAYYFLCFIAPIIFAFAAGAVPYRPPLAHAAAFMGLVAAPWIYENAMTDWGLGNTWLVLNVPDNELGWYAPHYAQMTILFVGLIAAAVVTAGLRLLPPHWQLRKSPIRERTWPAIAASALLLGVWFSQSVMPYRIPGAVDYSSWPTLQILHIEKRGLQFHESCVSVGGGGMRHPGESVSVSVSFSPRGTLRGNCQSH